jgi:hypothetical protein
MLKSVVMEIAKKLSPAGVAALLFVAAVFVVMFWNDITSSLESVLKLALKAIFAVFLCVLAYQGYDGMRSGVTGTQPTTAKEVEDPTSFSHRFAGIALGLILWAMTLIGASWLFNWDWPFRLLFGK